MTKTQLHLLKKRFPHPIQIGRSIPDTPEQWMENGKPHCMILLAKHQEYEGWVDGGYGHDCLWDGKEWHITSKGVFLDEVVFLSDSYGYPKGALFIRANKPV